MKKFAQILNKKAHWIFESEEKPEFAPNIVLVEITGQDHVCEGWDYDGGVFTAPIIVVPEPIDPQPSTDEIIRANYLETQYQTALLEMQSEM